MKRTFALTIVLLVGSVVPGWAQGTTVFYDGFDEGDTAGWWAPARVGETGQTTCYDPATHEVVVCAGTGQDGDKRGGVAWPNPRFTVNGDGTTTDNLTGLIWLTNANCFGGRNWANALADANGLASGSCGLTDASVAGAWRLPSFNELQSLVDYQFVGPALSDAAGTAKWGVVPANDAFSGVRTGYYWSSLSYVGDPSLAWDLNLGGGYVTTGGKTNSFYVWPVRTGWWAPARVGETGQTTCYDPATHEVVVCAGTGQDGDMRGGVEWPNPRFTVNGDGTSTDNLTGLIWLTNANCFGARSWASALADANGLASGSCGLTDGSVAGAWRLPSVDELQSLVDYQFVGPALSDAAGTAKWGVVPANDAFSGVRTGYYWSSLSYVGDFSLAWFLNLGSGSVIDGGKTISLYVWPVRTGQ